MLKQHDHESRATLTGCVEIYAAIVAFDDPAAQGKPDACPGIELLIHVQPLEDTENSLRLLRVNSDSIVFDIDFQPVGNMPGASLDLDSRIRLTVLQRVRKKVLKQLREKVEIGIDSDIAFDIERRLRFADIHRKIVPGKIERFGQLKILGIDPLIGQLGIFQQTGRHLFHRFTALRDVARECRKIIDLA